MPVDERRTARPPLDRFAGAGIAIERLAIAACNVGFRSLSVLPMGTKRIETVWDLVRHGANLQVWCACGRIAVIDRHELDYMRMKRHWPHPLGYLRGKLRCAKCGQRPTKISPCANDPTVRIGLSLAEAIAAQRRDET